MGKPRFKAGKAFDLRIRIRQICAPQSFLVRVCPQVGSVDEQNHWLGLLLAGLNSVCQDVCGSCCKPLPTSSLSDSPAIPLSEIRVGTSTKWPTMLEESGHLPWFSYHIGGTRSSGKTSPCGAALSWGRGNAGNTSFTLLMKSVLVFQVKGNLSASPQPSKIVSEVCLSWLDISSYKGNRVSNNLWCYLDDIYFFLNLFFLLKY